MKRLIVGALAATTVALVGAFSAASAQAATFYQNYLVNPTYDLRSIVLLQYTANGGGSTNSFDAFAPSTMITDPFLKTEDLADTYFLGVSAYGAEDSEPTDHLVLALDDTFASGLLGFDFSELFPGFEEVDLISALDLLASPDTADNLDDKELAFDLIGSFSDQVRTNGGTFGSVDTFSLVGFSTATAVGSGESSITLVPEPATWALMIAGFGGAGAMLRRRRARETFAAV
ncbi:PEPxxWA-CTERM sorting domain-containing protein [Phenylobacterium sp.]|uniref:PEPxxWA-CTERM sorting domain-containing protein n=1 Tax=Phenylobacterium sp. TaxID=1871053 RepID=UPI0025F6111D|nr:PEPxxWA-CTERM sorting domain-containing protein [Phenylobacterium sp.]